MNIVYTLSAVALSAVITFVLRAFPFIVFNDKKKMPEFIVKLGAALPSAIMSVLVVYCLKSFKSDFSGTGIQGIIAAIVVGVSYKLKCNTFLSILLGTVVYMILIRIGSL